MKARRPHEFESAYEFRVAGATKYWSAQRAQFSDKSSGICASNRYLPPLARRIFCHSLPGAVSKMSSSEAGWLSQAVRFISSSSWPGLQPAYPANILILRPGENDSPISRSESNEWPRLRFGITLASGINESL